MAGKKIGEIYGEIKLKNTQFNTGLTKSQARMKAFGQAAKIAFAAMAAAAVAATAAVVKMTGDTIKYMNEVRKASLATGVAVEQFQELAYAAKQEHGDLAALEKGLGNLTIRLSYAGDGLETYLRYFRALGIEYKNQDGTLRNTIDVFYDIADKAHKGALSTEELAAITQLFGARAGRQLIPFLKLGSEGFKKLGIEGHNAGVVMSKEDVEAVKELDNKMTVLKSMVQGLTKQFVIGLLPALDTFAGTAEENALQTENLRNQVREFGYQAGLIFGFLAEGVRKYRIAMLKANEMNVRFTAILKDLFSWLPGYGDEIKYSAEQSFALAEAFREEALALQEQGSWVQKIRDWYNEAGETIKNVKKEIKEINEEIFIFSKVPLGPTRGELIRIEEGVKEVGDKIDTANIASNIFGTSLSSALHAGINSSQKLGEAMQQFTVDLGLAIVKAAILKSIMKTLGLDFGGGGGLFGLGFMGLQKGGYVPSALMSPNLPKISEGYANKPSLLVGEGKGEGETIVPDSRWKDMITVNLSNMVPLEKAFVDVYINLPQGQKQQIYRRGIKPAMDIEGVR